MSHSMSREDLEFLHEMRGPYLQDAPNVTHQLAIAYEQWMKDVRNQEFRNAMKRLTHTLAGNAGTYGYPDISLISKQLELFVQDSIQLSAEKLDSLMHLASRGLAAIKDLFHLAQVEHQQITDPGAHPPKAARSIYRSDICLVNSSDKIYDSLKLLLEKNHFRVVAISGTHSAVPEGSNDLQAVVLHFKEPPPDASRLFSLLENNPFANLPLLFLNFTPDIRSNLHPQRLRDFIMEPFAAYELILKLSMLIYDHQKANRS